MITVGISDDRADLELLSMANEKGKFGLDLRGIDDPNLQHALERGIDQDLFTLVDISFVAMLPLVLMRVFKLTPKGRRRLAELREALS